MISQKHKMPTTNKYNQKVYYIQSDIYQKPDAIDKGQHIFKKESLPARCVNLC